MSRTDRQFASAEARQAWLTENAELLLAYGYVSHQEQGRGVILALNPQDVQAIRPSLNGLPCLYAPLTLANDKGWPGGPEATRLARLYEPDTQVVVQTPNEMPGGASTYRFTVPGLTTALAYTLWQKFIHDVADLT